MDWANKCSGKTVCYRTQDLKPNDVTPMLFLGGIVFHLPICVNCLVLIEKGTLRKQESSGKTILFQQSPFLEKHIHI